MTHHYYKAIALPLLTALVFWRGTCSTTTNEESLRLQGMNYYIGLSGNAKAKEQLLRVINSAKTEIVGVFNDLSDTDISSALIEKANAGLKVGIGGDRRNRSNAGFAALENLRGSNKFLDYNAATIAAAAEPNQSLKNKILATRLNYNRLKHWTKPLKYNAEAYDGRVEYNFVVADQYTCWISTGGANSATFSSGMSIVFVFQSFDICNDFYNEAQQLAYGGLFGDEGVPSFGKFRNNKTITDPNTRFRLGDLIFNIYFAPQEKPLTAVTTELLRAESSIKFAARAITQDVINNVATHVANRSHILSVLQYKARIPQLYGQSFAIQGIVGTETDTGTANDVPQRDIPAGVTCSPATPDPAFRANYENLSGGACPTINSGSLILPFWDTNPCPKRQTVYNTVTLANNSSIHCDLKVLHDTIGNAATVNIRKYATGIPYNVFMTDYSGRKPRIILMSSDLRKRYYYDEANSQDAEPLRTQNDFYHITDAFVMIIEPAGSATDMKIFNDFNTMVTTLISAGGNL
jgi:hypothetical protein